MCIQGGRPKSGFEELGGESIVLRGGFMTSPRVSAHWRVQPECWPSEYVQTLEAGHWWAVQGKIKGRRDPRGFSGSWNGHQPLQGSAKLPSHSHARTMHGNNKRSESRNFDRRGQVVTDRVVRHVSSGPRG